MRRKLLKILCSCMALPLGVAVIGASYTLPNGKVLVDPYILGKTPNGLEVGHNGGVMFVKFADMPEEFQKKFNYDPAAAAAFEKRQAAQKEKRAADEKARKAAVDEQYQKTMQGWESGRLDNEIQANQQRINFLKTEIPKLEEQCNKIFDKATTMAGSSAGGSGKQVGYAWAGGYMTGSDTSNQMAEQTKKKTVTRLGQEYATMKKTLTSYKNELEAKELQLPKLQKRADQLKAKSVGK